MLSFSRDELQDVFKQLDLAIHWHEKWFAELTRTLVCKMPHDRRDLADDAERHCRFGQWYYGTASEQLHEHPSFAAIAEEHRRMHQLAKRLLLASAQENAATAMEYDAFQNAVDHLRLEINTLKHDIEESLYNRDALTGAENRTRMLGKLRESQELIKRGVHECSLCIMDIDHFKSINDTYGHLVGDEILVALVNYIKLNLRPYDQVYRYGGEEFLVSLPSTDLQTAFRTIDRIRTGIAGLSPETSAPKDISVTASFGITSLSSDISVEESIKRADIALYSAKQSGRNRTCLWEPAMASVRE